MTNYLCPICGAGVTQAHDCSDYILTNFSLELELLRLPFDLEPYAPASEPYHLQNISAINTKRNSQRTGAERILANFNMHNRPVPLFLRL